MCGFCATIHLGRQPVERELIDRMNEVARHRGPDSAGALCEGPVGLGHTRLSIIDIENRSNQPMSRHSAHLVYNGEIYNYLELRAALETEGHVFSTSSDTEVLLMALQAWGQAALNRLCGMFAFAYYNTERDEVWVVRDRFGIKPLVWARVGQMVLFASEAKQILASGLVTPVLNRETALAYLGRGALNIGAATFFKGIEEIRAGEMAVISLSRASVEIAPWYRLVERIMPQRLPYAEAVEAVRERLKISIMRHHRSDVPLGSCLSGGIDSSSIVTLSRALFPEKDLPTISIFAPYDGYNETQFSRAVAEVSRVQAIEVEADTQRFWDPDVQEEFCYYLDQPLPDGSHYNQSLVFKTARENGFTVMLDGQGADEYFGGYGEFWYAAQYELLRSGQLRAFIDGLRANAMTMKRPFKTEIARFMIHFMLGCATMRKKPRPQALGPIRTAWLRGLPAPSFFPPPRIGVQRFKDLSLEQIGVTSIPYQLHSEDRNSMRWSIESRVPFLDHELVECVMNLPAEYRVGQGYQKRILRDAVPELPALVAQRKNKIGFASPDAIALRMRVDEVRETLRTAARTFEDLLDSAVVISAYDAMVARHEWYAPAFQRIVSLHAWQRAHGVTV